MKISIIIPAYNVEKYIGDMLKDVLNQSFGDFEAIIVNDGSTDNTQSIIDDYCSKDFRFKSIIKENGGVSSARNAGLDVAKGDYIVFWDPDDTIPEKSLEYLYDSITREQADMAIGMRVLDTMTEMVRAVTLSELIKQKEISRMDAKLVWVFSACNKIFKRDIIEKNNLRFRNISLGEDSIFWIEYLKYINKIVGCPHDVYIYKRRLFIDNSDSLTQKSNRHYEGYFDTYIQYLEQAFNDVFDSEPKNTENIYYKEKLFQELYKRLCRENIIGGMYRFIWTLDENGENILRDAFNNIWNKIYCIEREDVKSKEKDLDLTNGLKSKKEIIENPKITFVITRNVKAPVTTLQSIYKQNFPEFEVLIDSKSTLMERNDLLVYPNIRYVNGKDLAEIKNNSVVEAKGTWIMFFEDEIISGSNSIKSFMRKVGNNDNLVSLYAKTIGDRTLNEITLLNKAFTYKDKRIKKEVDNTFSNKMIRVNYIRNSGFKFSNNSRRDMISLYDIANVTRQKSTVMLTHMTNEDYRKNIKHWKAKVKLKYMR